MPDDKQPTDTTSAKDAAPSSTKTPAVTTPPAERPPQYTLDQHVKHAHQIHGQPSYIVAHVLKGADFGDTDFVSADEIGKLVTDFLDHEVVPAGQEAAS